MIHFFPQEVLDEISKYSTKVAINISPKVLSQVIAAVKQEETKEEEKKTVLPSNSNVKSPAKSNDKCKYSDTIFFELQTEAELPIIEYEEDRLKCLLVNLSLYFIFSYSFQEERKICITLGFLQLNGNKKNSL